MHVYWRMTDENSTAPPLVYTESRRVASGRTACRKSDTRRVAGVESTVKLLINAPGVYLHTYMLPQKPGRLLETGVYSRLGVFLKRTLAYITYGYRCTA